MESNDDQLLSKLIKEKSGTNIPLIQFLISNESDGDDREKICSNFKENSFNKENSDICQISPHIMNIRSESNRGTIQEVWKVLSQKLDNTLEEIFSDVSKLVKEDLESSELKENLDENTICKVYSSEDIGSLTSKYNEIIDNLDFDNTEVGVDINASTTNDVSSTFQNISLRYENLVQEDDFFEQRQEFKRKVDDSFEIKHIKSNLKTPPKVCDNLLNCKNPLMSHKEQTDDSSYVINADHFSELNDKKMNEMTNTPELDERKSMTPELNERNFMTLVLDERKSLTPELTERNSMIPQLERKLMTPELNERNSMTPELNERNSLTPEPNERNSIIPQLERKLMTPKFNEKNSMTPVLDERNSLTLELNERNSMIPKLDESKLMTPRLNERNSMTPELNERKSLAPELNTKESMTPTEKDSKNNSNSFSVNDERISTVIQEMLLEEEDDNCMDNVETNRPKVKSRKKRTKGINSKIKPIIIRKSSRTPKRIRLDYSPENTVRKRKKSPSSLKKEEPKHQSTVNINAKNNKTRLAFSQSGIVNGLISNQGIRIKNYKTNQKLKCDYPNCSFSSTYEYNIIYHNKKTHNGIKWSPESEHNEGILSKDKSSGFQDIDIDNEEQSELWKKELKEVSLVQKCSLCEYVTISKKAFKHHETIHIKSKLNAVEVPHSKQKKDFKCTKCEFSTNREANLMIHRTLRHSDANFPSIRTENQNVTSGDVINNIAQDENSLYSFRNGYWRCLKCTYTNIKLSSVKRHQVSHRKNGKKLGRPPKLKTKFNVENSSRNSSVCGSNNFSNNNKDSLKRHKQLNLHTDTLLGFEDSINSTECDDNDSLKKAHESSKQLNVCSKCDFSTSSYEKFNNHVLKKHIEKYKCNKCNFSTNLLSNLTKHENTHTNENPSSNLFKCSKCEYTSYFRGNVQNHELQHFKNEEVLKIIIFKCSQCSYTSEIKTDVEDHLNEKHSIFEISKIKKSEILKCIYCNCTLKLRRSSNTHKCVYNVPDSHSKSSSPISHNKNDIKAKNNSPLTPIAKTKPSRLKSSKIDSGNIKSATNLPSESANSKLKSSNAIYVETNSASNKIMKDLNTFTNCSDTNSKKYNNSNKLKYRCEICNYKTNIRSLIGKHQLVHLSIKTLKCTQCSYKTNFLKHLKQHQLCHLLIKRFSCPKCKFSTNYNAQIKRHMANKHLD